MSKPAKPITITRETPAETAKIFRPLYDPNLLHSNGDWLSWRNGAYVEVEKATVEAAVQRFLEQAKVTRWDEQSRTNKLHAFNPKAKDANEVMEALEKQCHIPADTMAPPCWLADTPEPYNSLDARNVISCRNGVLDIATRELLPPTPFLFTRTALAMDYRNDAPIPERWLSFLDEVFMGRQSLIDLLQEIIGYCISTNTSMQKVFFMLGETRAGKGTILRILTMLVGRVNTAFPSIETIGTPKGQENLIGKSLAQVTDMNTDNRHGGVGTIVATINAISGEDGMTIPRLYKSSWNGTLGTRIVLAGNIMPNFGSHARPLAARLLILPFEVSFEGREDTALTDKLAAELPGILNWALDGYARLMERGRFDEPEESKAAKLRLLYKSDPIHGFVAECCKRTNDPDLGTDKDILYAAFRRYCIKSGQTSIPAVKDFTEKLISTVPGINHRRRRVGDERERYYGGIRLTDEQARRVYKLNPRPSRQVADLIELGVADAYDLLLLDEHGWPVPKPSAEYAEDDFSY